MYDSQQAVGHYILCAMQENVWSVKDLVNTQKDDGLSRGVPTSAPLRA